MINYTKKWWLLRCFRKAEMIHSIRGDNNGRRVLLSQILFIEGNDKNGNDPWNGLANKFPGNLRSLKNFKLWKETYVDFKLDWFIFWKKEYSKKKLAKRVNKFNDIYEVCFRDGYIIKDEPTRYPSISTPKAYKIRSFPFGYLQGLLDEYDSVWVKIILPIIAFLLGIVWSPKFINFIKGIFGL